LKPCAIGQLNQNAKLQTVKEHRFEQFYSSQLPSMLKKYNTL